MWPTRYYTQENTQGYTDEQLDAFNRELCDLLADAVASNDGELSPDQVNELIQRHSDEVARR